jgi:hypothetical protein
MHAYLYIYKCILVCFVYFSVLFMYNAWTEPYMYVYMDVY